MDQTKPQSENVTASLSVTPLWVFFFFLSPELLPNIHSHDTAIDGGKHGIVGCCYVGLHHLYQEFTTHHPQ